MHKHITDIGVNSSGMRMLRFQTECTSSKQTMTWLYTDGTGGLIRIIVDLYANHVIRADQGSVSLFTPLGWQDAWTLEESLLTARFSDAYPAGEGEEGGTFVQPDQYHAKQDRDLLLQIGCEVLRMHRAESRK